MSQHDDPPTCPCVKLSIFFCRSLYFSNVKNKINKLNSSGWMTSSAAANIALYKDPKNVIPIWIGSQGGVRVAPEWHTPSQSYYMAWDTLTMLTLRWAGGREFDPRPGQYSRMSFHPTRWLVQFSLIWTCLSFQILNLFWTLSSWGSGNYRPSAPLLYEVASHVKQLPFRPLLLIELIQ